MTETPLESKLVQALQEKLKILPPEKRRELLAKIWEMIDQQQKTESE